MIKKGDNIRLGDSWLEVSGVMFKDYIECISHAYSIPTKKVIHISHIEHVEDIHGNIFKPTSKGEKRVGFS